MHHVVEIHAPAIIQSPIMVYNTKEQLVNASQALRVGISSADHNTSFTIWFDDGLHRQTMNRIFSSYEEADEFLHSIYNIKE